MTRSKNFTREDVLEKSMPLFWKKGFAATSLRDLEITTGVNKSGLYSEFKDKEDIFLASLAYYVLTRGGKEILEASPLGWGNIEKFLRSVLNSHCGQDGCFMIYSMRDYALLSATGKKNVLRHLDKMRFLVLKNLENVKSGADAEQLTDIVLMFFTGLALTQSSDASVHSEPSVNLFLDAVKRL
jgi:AcrR family transcriptional regulator